MILCLLGGGENNKNLKFVYPHAKAVPAEPDRDALMLKDVAPSPAKSSKPKQKDYVKIGRAVMDTFQGVASSPDKQQKACLRRFLTIAFKQTGFDVRKVKKNGGQARDQLSLLERRFGGEEGRRWKERVAPGS